MEEIRLSQEPSYSFTATRDGVTYQVYLRSFSDMAFATVLANGSVVASGVRCVGGGWLIPYAHKMGDGGNFRFECSDEHYPFYTNYGVTSRLVYCTPSEYAKEKESA